MSVPDVKFCAESNVMVALPKLKSGPENNTQKNFQEEPNIGKNKKKRQSLIQINQYFRGIIYVKLSGESNSTTTQSEKSQKKVKVSGE